VIKYVFHGIWMDTNLMATAMVAGLT